MRCVFTSLLSIFLIAAAAPIAELRADEAVMKKAAPAEMVAALVSKNRPPRYVEHRLLKVDKVPIFPADYDWKEYQRVRSAISAIDRGMTPELWEELLKHFGDKRYSITLANTSPGVPDEDAGRDFTVGDFCEAIAYATLGELNSRHSVSAEDDLKPWVRIAAHADIADLAAWRKKRADKSLWRLQVEACTLALKDVETLKQARAEQKAAIRKGIQSEIDKLNAAKKPTMLPRYLCADGGVIHIDGWHEASYNAELAESLRKEYADGERAPRDK